MSWATIAGGGIGLITLAVLIYLVKRSEDAKHEEELNRGLTQANEDLVNSIHQQEIREADHEERVSEIIHSDHLDPDRIDELLNKYPSSTGGPRKTGS